MKKKVLLMGKSGSGKTSMRSVIFENRMARDTWRLGATVDVEHSHVRFPGGLVLNLWDCGGWHALPERCSAGRRGGFFRDVAALVYVFDVGSRDLEEDAHLYQSCLEAILQSSPAAGIFCLLHKMDLVQEDQRDLVFAEREEDLRRLSRPLECACFRTSIWDETLYRAWSSVVCRLLPNARQLEASLSGFARIIEAEEVLLFESATFLAIAHYQRGERREASGAEISNIMRHFRLSCQKLAAAFQSMEVRNSHFAAFLRAFTSNTCVMVVMSDPSIPSAVTLINIRNAGRHFEKLDRPELPERSLLAR
ncbi:LOW QUALITY PROTEIN: ras-related GTP-binding protein A-like [Phyllostomus hastatus]|uniref:LOW QUALITY PROTEIN: ras-related GTP-binding protein A-like n=1 Tax=Phyllostomus hastatus TaxID=9423 RepID=UPI001E6859A0|nr:LOW QUALITY PROTEIN: ras-related GTP-binding protein A-like [Phyllostomus hastatus]